MHTNSDIPKGKPSRMMQILDENGRPTGQYIMIKNSVIDKIANSIKPKLSVH